MTADEPLTVRRGEDLTTWPWIKMRMALGQVDELSAHVDIWNLEHPVVATPDVSDDRRIVEYRITEWTSPPVTHWSAIVGNAIASLRSAADSFAWQIAHLDGKTPPNPKTVYFPMSKKPKVWKQRVDALGDVHPDLLGRFEDLRGAHDGQWLVAMSAIAELNNTDKHKSPLQIMSLFEPAALQGLIELPGGHGGMTMTPEAIREPRATQVGDVVLRVRFSGPITGASGTVRGAVVPLLDNEEDTFEDAVTLVRGMHNALWYGLHYLCTGAELGRAC
ncbi:hypothetical protein [Flexivirga alba]|uniref:Uncharacterized protein n=1 Tax=Flexivirga alba TaxID=702742 RepID=A0ABW2AJG4_9MICO